MKKLLPSLYKRTQTGAIQEWQLEIDGDQYRAITGQVDGKKIYHEWRKAEPTNVGRSNARTGEEQALFEAEANFKKRKDLGYAESIADVDKTKFFQPMLAHDFKKNMPKFDGKTVYLSQPKLDGIRCIITNDGAFTRTGKRLMTVDHILNQVQPIFDENPDAVLDGELYNHTYRHMFNEICSLVKKTKPTPEAVELSEQYVQFWWYDIVSDESYEQRFKTIQGLFNKHDLADRSVVVTPTKAITTKQEAMELFEEYAQEEYEGQILRVDGVGYETKRTKNLLKHKDFDDEEFEIESIEYGKGNRSNIAGYVNCITKDGKRFSAGIMGSHEFCRKLMEERNEYVGGEATIVFFRYTHTGVPRFPKAKALFKGKRDV